MPKWVVYVGFMCLYALITFFGLGPVLLADGSSEERTATFVVVLLLYVITTAGLWWSVRGRGR